MLTRSPVARVILLAALMLLSMVMLLPSGVRAVADPGVTCPDGQALDARTQTCRIYIVNTGAPTGPGDAPVQPVSGGSGGEVTACVDRSLGRNDPLPCESDRGYWSNAMNCYVRLRDPQPPKSSSLWQGREDGAIYDCGLPAGQDGPPTPFWSASMPAGPAAPVDPAVVAQTIVTQMELRAFDIGMVPEDRPDSMGIVGLPMWLWVNNPSEQTFGPMVRSASLGSVTVTATADVQRIVWDMGDGGAVTCTTVGTPFTDGHGGNQSPDCGYTYTRQGTYAIAATAYWNVAWASNTGVTGNIPLEFTSTRQVVVGEIQVVRR